MKKILMGLMAMALVIGMIGVGTMAYFSDTETSTGNSFAAGDLNLTGVVAQVVTAGPGTVTLINEGDGGNFAFTVTDVAPGSAGLDTWTLTNTGSLAGTLSFTVSAITNDDNGCNEPETAVPDASCDPAGGGELGANMTVTLAVGGVSVYAGLLDGMPAAYAGGAMASGGTVVVTLDWSIDGGVGNIIQSDSAEFDITFVLDQS